MLDSARRRRFPGTVFGAVIAVTIVLAVALSACGDDDDDDSAQSAEASTTPTDITFSLDFLVDGLHAPFYLAQDLGWFEDSNLNVDIRTATGSSDAVARVGSGRAQLGLSTASVALNGIARGLPIQAVAVLLVHSAQATETLRTSNITDVQGLRGHSIGITPAGGERELISAILELNDVSPDEVDFVSITAENGKALLLSEQVDAVSFFPAIFADVQEDVNIIPWFEYGLDIYGTTIIVNTDFAEENPEAVTAFVNNAMRGLQYTLDNPDEAAETVANHAEGEVEFFRTEMDIYEPYWLDPALQEQGLGYMTDERWAETQEISVEYLDQEQELPLDQVYTNEFLGDPVSAP